MNYVRCTVNLTDEDLRNASSLAEKRAALKTAYNDQRYSKLTPVQTEYNHVIGEMAVARFLNLQYSTHKRRTRAAYRSDFTTQDNRPIGLWIKTTSIDACPFFRKGMRYPLNKIPFVFVDVKNPFKPVIYGWIFTTDLLGIIDKSTRKVAVSDLHDPHLLLKVVEKVANKTPPNSKPFEMTYASLDNLLR